MHDRPIARAAALPLFYRMPLLGPMLRDAVFGHPDAKYYFIANLFITFGWATYLYGYPFVITIAKIAAAAVLLLIVLLTSTDLWENRRRRRGESADQGRQTRA
jgi:hypothetical protein